MKKRVISLIVLLAVIFNLNVSNIFASELNDENMNVIKFDVSNKEMTADVPTMYSTVALPSADLKNVQTVEWRTFIPKNTFVQLKVVVSGRNPEYLQILYKNESTDEMQTLEHGHVWYTTYLINTGDTDSFYKFYVTNFSAGTITVSGSLTY